MSERANHFKIGVFVLIGLSLFLIALFALGFASAFFAKGYDFETFVPGGVENLSVGAVVKLRGVTVGKVTAIKFIGKEQPEYKQQAVLICFEVRPDAGLVTKPANNVQQMLDTEIAHGLRARVQSEGFLGPSILSLEYVNPKYYPIMSVAWATNRYYIPSAPSQFEHVFASLESTLSHTEDLDLPDLLRRTTNLVETANVLVSNINLIDFKHLGTNANSLMVELRETNRGLKDALTNAQDVLTDAQDAINGADVPALSRETLAMEDRVSRAANELNRVLTSVDTEEMNAALANARAATEELTVLLHKLKERPSSVLFSKAPKPASSVEEPPKNESPKK